MAEAYTVFNGQVVRLTDEPIQDFVSDIDLVSSMHPHGQFETGALAEHAEDLRQITSELVQDGYGIDSSNGQRNFWYQIIDLTYLDKEAGAKVRGAYVYARTNRILANEFGPSESPTVDILRALAGRLFVSREVELQQKDVGEYLESPFAQDILDAIYPTPNQASVPDTELGWYLGRLHGNCHEFNTDSALARIVAALHFLDCGLVDKMSREAVMGSLQANQSLFKNTKLSRATQIVESPFDDEEIDDEESGDESDTTDTWDDDEAIEYTRGVSSSDAFDITQGECYIPRDKRVPVEVWLQNRAQMNSMMFPTDGVGSTIARQICKDCVVKGPCLEFALATRMDNGIWGGASERERRRMIELRAIGQS